MKGKALFVLFFALFLCGIQAQESDEWYLEKPIKDFIFSGLEAVNLSEIRPIVRPYIEKTFTYELFWEIQGKLYALDYFEEISAEPREVDSDRNSVIIEFEVTERPTLNVLLLEGNQKLSRVTILDKVLLKKGDFINQSDIDIDVESIRQLYLEKGFPDVEVEGRMDTSDGVSVIFSIDEGSETKIKEIAFSGNTFASEGTLRREMQTKEQTLFTSGNYRENVLLTDKARIEIYYRNYGYVDATVVNIDKKTERDEEANRTYLYLTFFIEEGAQYTYGGVEFEGNEVFSTDELNELVRLKTGEILNIGRVESAFQQIIGLYGNNGYIYNQINRNEVRDEDKKSIRYLISIKEFDKAHIENIILQGNEKTKDYVIFRELPFETGDIYSLDNVRQGWLNLYNLQYFSAIDIKPVPGTAHGLLDVVINMEEQSWADFNFGFSFSGGEFPIAGQVGWTDKNFLGTGRTIGANLEASTNKQGLSANFQDNYLFGKDWGGGISFSVSHNLISNVFQDITPPIFTDQDIPDPYGSWGEYQAAVLTGLSIPYFSTMDYDSLDISLSLNTSTFLRTRLGRLGANTGLSSTATYLWYNSDFFRPYNQTVRDNLRALNFVNTWGTTLYWDNRDIYYNPTKGHYLSQYLGFTGGFLFGARHYIKLNSRAEGFLTLFSIPVTEKYDFKMILAAHTAISFLFPPFGRTDIVASPQDMLAIDGTYNARGWPYRATYRALWENSLEFRIPILEQFLWWISFFDVAAGWPEISSMGSMSIDDYYFSFGGGLRFTMPGLPIRIYLSQTFKAEEGKVIWGEGDFPVGPLGLKFVISFTRPGGF